MIMPMPPPDWVPKVADGQRILVTGGSGGLGTALIDMLLSGSNCIIGAHGATKPYVNAPKDGRVIPLLRAFDGEADCLAVIDEFAEAAGGIDALVCLNGRLHFSGHWMDMPAADFEADMTNNFVHPFYLARAAMKRMKAEDTGGRILLNGTESAIHGGSSQSLPYASAKLATECLVKGMAREGAASGILVNGVRFGYIISGFHQRWHEQTEEDARQRADLVPLKRGGTPDEAAALMIFLLSDWSRFITGQMYALTGGDWL